MYVIEKAFDMTWRMKKVYYNNYTLVVYGERYLHLLNISCTIECLRYELVDSNSIKALREWRNTRFGTKYYIFRNFN